MPTFSDNVLSALDFWWPQDVAEQGGILSGDDPTQYSSTDPYRLWVIQVGMSYTPLLFEYQRFDLCQYFL